MLLFYRQEDTSSFAEDVACCVNNSQRTYSYRMPKPIPSEPFDRAKPEPRGLDRTSHHT